MDPPVAGEPPAAATRIRGCVFFRRHHGVVGRGHAPGTVAFRHGRMLAYGEIDARVKPSNRGLQSGCTLESAAASSAAVSVLEACTNQADLRLVLLRPGKEDDEPIQRIVPEPGSGRVRAPGYWWYRRTTPPCTCLQDQARNREST